MAEAAAAGLPVMAHAQATDGIKNAVRAGIRSIEHGIYLDDEAIDDDARGRHLAGADAGRAARGARRGQERRAAARRASSPRRRRSSRPTSASFARAVAAGVKVAMGTDSGVGPHGSNLDELSLMAAGGMTPSDVLVATTSSAAQLLGLAAQTGSLTPGKRADVIVVAGDPFDLAALRQNIRAVYKDGRAVRGQLA